MNEYLPEHGHSHFFKYVNWESLKLILSKGTLKWTAPNKLDDIFDAQHEIRFEDDPLTMGLAIKSELRQLIFNPIEPRGLPDNPRFKDILLFRKNRHRFSIGEWDKQMQGVEDKTAKDMQLTLDYLNLDWSKWVSNLRLFCVSETKDSPVMWGLYAGAHHGAVLELRCLIEKDSALFAADQVIYSDKRPVLATTQEFMKHSTGQNRLRFKSKFQAFLCQKSNEWAYQKEWRVLLPVKNPSSSWELHSFEPEELGAVYLGQRVNGADLEEIVSTLASRYPKTAIYHAENSPDSYNLSFKLIRSP